MTPTEEVDSSKSNVPTAVSPIITDTLPSGEAQVFAVSMGSPAPAPAPSPAESCSSYLPLVTSATKRREAARARSSSPYTSASWRPSASSHTARSSITSAGTLRISAVPVARWPQKLLEKG